MINKDFFAALADLEREKGIGEEVFIEALQNALASACKKQYMGESGNVEVRLNPEKCTIKFYLHRTVVEGEPLEDGEISLADAQEKRRTSKRAIFLPKSLSPKISAESRHRRQSRLFCRNCTKRNAITPFPNFRIKKGN